MEYGYVFSCKKKVLLSRKEHFKCYFCGMDVLKNIANTRIEKGFSQEHMAKELSISQNNYSKIERGFTRLTVEKMIQIAEVLNVSPNKLISDPTIPSTDYETLEGMEKEIKNWKDKYKEEEDKNISLNNWIKDKESVVHKLQEEIESMRFISLDFFHKWVIYETKEDVRSYDEIIGGFFSCYLDVVEDSEKAKYISEKFVNDYEDFSKHIEQFKAKYPDEWNKFSSLIYIIAGSNKIFNIPKIIQDEVLTSFKEKLKGNLTNDFFQLRSAAIFFSLNVSEIEKINPQIADLWYRFKTENPML